MRPPQGSESPTPATGHTGVLLSSPPGRLLSASSRDGGEQRPWWLKTGKEGNPLVRYVPQGKKRSRLPPSSPPIRLQLKSSSPFTANIKETNPFNIHISGGSHHSRPHNSRSPWSDPSSPRSSERTLYSEHEVPLNDVARPLSRARPPTPRYTRSSSRTGYSEHEVPLNDVARPLSRARPATPHPKTSSSHPSRKYGVQWDQYGGDSDDDTLPPDSPPSDKLKKLEDIQEIEIEAPRACVMLVTPSPNAGLLHLEPEGEWGVDEVAEQPLKFEDVLQGVPDDASNMSELEGSVMGQHRRRQLGQRQLTPPRHQGGLTHHPSSDQGRRDNLPVDLWETWDYDNDPWGFRVVRGLTSGHIPHQYEGNPSSDDRRFRRRYPPPSTSPVQFSPSPTPPSRPSTRNLFASSPINVPQRFTPPPPLRSKGAWRGKRLLQQYLTRNRWPVPRGSKHDGERDPIDSLDDGSDDDDSEEEDQKYSRKNRTRKRRRTGRTDRTTSFIVPDTREMSPTSLAAREARIAHFKAVDNFKLHVEHVLG